MSKLYNWWNRKAIARAAEITNLQSQIAETRMELNDTKTQLAAIEAVDTNRRTSVDPWFRLESSGLDPIKGMSVELDWNEAFIQHLKDAGHGSRNENVIIQKWMAMLYTHLIDSLEAEAIEESTQAQHQPNEFE